MGSDWIILIDLYISFKFGINCNLAIGFDWILFCLINPNTITFKKKLLINCNQNCVCHTRGNPHPQITDSLLIGLTDGTPSFFIQFRLCQAKVYGTIESIEDSVWINDNASQVAVYLETFIIIITWAHFFFWTNKVNFVSTFRFFMSKFVQILIIY